MNNALSFASGSIALLLFSVCCDAKSAISTTAGLITISEMDDDSGERAWKTGRIVDINSTLQISIDRKTVQNRTAQIFATGTLPPSVLPRLRVLTTASEQGLAGLGAMQAAIKAWETSAKDADAIEALSSGLEISHRAALKVVDLALLYPNLEAKLERALEAAIESGEPLDMTTQDRLVLEIAAEEAKELEQEIAKALEMDGVYVRLGAWLVHGGKRKPVHLQGFDDYPEGERYEVERWSLALSGEQKAQLEELSDRAKEVNEKGLKAVVDFESASSGVFLAVEKAASGCLKEVRTRLEEASKAAALDAARVNEIVRTDVSQAEEAVSGYSEFLKLLRDKYIDDSRTSGSAVDLLVSTNADLAELQSRTAALISRLETIKALPEKLLAAGRNSATEKAVKALLATSETCVKELGDGIASTAQNLKGWGKLLVAGRRLDNSLFTFGEEVKKIDIPALPPTVTVSLKDTGFRADGDEVVIKFAAGNRKGELRELEVHRMDLDRVLPHFEVVVGLVFVDPSGESGLVGRFQAAPSYSVLLKGGSRRSPFYNRLFDFGVGVNMAALDFNHDDTPEVGAGIVVSGIRDYLQAGYGYNVNADTFYGFFGLRLPLPSMTMSPSSAADE